MTNNTQSKQHQFVRDPGYDETETKCTVNGNEFAVVYLVNSEVMTPLGDKARRELIESERALAEVEHREPRFLNLVPVWCLNAASDIVAGRLTPEINRQGRGRDSQIYKICAVPGCHHPVAKRSVHRKGINYLFCGGCAAALSIVAAKAGRNDLLPVDAEKARADAEKARAERLAKQTAKSALAATLLGPTTARIKADGQLVNNPFTAVLGAIKAETPKTERPSRPNGKKARKTAAPKAETRRKREPLPKDLDKTEIELVTKYGLGIVSFLEACRRSHDAKSDLTREIAKTPRGWVALNDYFDAVEAAHQNAPGPEPIAAPVSVAKPADEAQSQA